MNASTYVDAQYSSFYFRAGLVSMQRKIMKDFRLYQRQITCTRCDPLVINRKIGRGGNLQPSSTLLLFQYNLEPLLLLISHFVSLPLE